MKLFVVVFLAVALNCVSSSPTSLALLPLIKSDDTPSVQSSVTVNGNVTIQVNDNRKSCCTKEHKRPKLPIGYVILTEDDNTITAIKYHSSGQTWNEARKTCFHEGAFLAYATCKEEQDLYFKMMASKKIDKLWIGIHDYFAEGDFATVLGEVAKEVAYYTWIPGEPNNSGIESCTHYWRTNGKQGLNDVACVYQFPFNCKIKLRKD